MRAEGEELKKVLTLCAKLLAFRILKMFKFEKLEIWKKAVKFADTIYSATKNFSVEERYRLTSQLRRSAVSISANIAEGSSRSSDKDFSRFIEIAYGSLMEAVSESEIARRQGFLKQDIFTKIYTQAEELSMMLSGFRRKLVKKPISES